MTTLPQVIAAVPVGLRPDLEDAASYARAEKATAARRAYNSDFVAFRAWCEAKDLIPLPAWPETVAAFLASEAKRGVKASTIGRRVAAIRYAHKLAGHEPPTNCDQSVQKYPLRLPYVGKYDLIGANSETKAHLCMSCHRFGANHAIGCAIHLACWSLHQEARWPRRNVGAKGRSGVAYLCQRGRVPEGPGWQA
jgi:hypothetical protein